MASHVGGAAGRTSRRIAHPAGSFYRVVTSDHGGNTERFTMSRSIEPAPRCRGAVVLDPASPHLWSSRTGRLASLLVLMAGAWVLAMLLGGSRAGAAPAPLPRPAVPAANPGAPLKTVLTTVTGHLQPHHLTAPKPSGPATQPRRQAAPSAVRPASQAAPVRPAPATSDRTPAVSAPDHHASQPTLARAVTHPVTALVTSTVRRPVVALVPALRGR